MADKKISALTGASTPLAGTEVLPIVQGGSTVKVSVANLTAGRAVSASTLTSAGSVTAGVAGYTFNGTSVLASDGSSNYLSTGAALYIQGGGVIYTGNSNIAPAAGKGIDFSANTHAAGMTSELLNWYEEGNWTPTVGGTWTANPASLDGKYTRIGRMVYVTFTFAGGSKATATSGWIDSLPFNVGISGTGAVVDSNIGNFGLALAANSTRVWLTANAFGAGTNYVTVAYMV
jgi:hypothetical protein